LTNLLLLLSSNSMKSTRLLRLASAIALAPTLVLAAPPINDKVSKAITLTGTTGDISSTNDEATLEDAIGEPTFGIEPDYISRIGTTVWYSFTPPETGWLEVQMDATNSNGGVPVVAPFTVYPRYFQEDSSTGYFEPVSNRNFRIIPCTKGVVRKLQFDTFNDGNFRPGTFGFSYRFVAGAGFKVEGAPLAGTNPHAWRENQGPITITVVRTASTEGTATVDYELLNGTADGATDLASGGSPLTGTLTFAPGEGRKVLSFPITNDAQAEGAETFSFILKNPSEGNTVLARVTPIVIEDDEGTIANDNFADAIVLSGNSDVKDFLLIPATREAGEPGTLNRTLWYRWTAPSNGVVTLVTGAIGGTGQAVFTGSALSNLVQVRPVVTYGEPHEVDLGGYPADGQLTLQYVVQAGTTYQIAVPYWDPSQNFGGTGSITLTHNSVDAGDNTFSVAAVRLAQRNYSALESDGKVTVKLMRSGNTTGKTNVTFQTANSPFGLYNAADNLDYQSVNQTVTFAPGETEKLVEVTITPDTKKEGIEEFEVILSSNQPNCPIDAYERATVLIVDGKKLPVEIQFTATINNGALVPQNGPGGEGTISVKMTSSGAFTGTLIRDGVKSSLKGQLPPLTTGVFSDSTEQTLNITRKNLPSLVVTVRYSIQNNSGIGAISGTVSDGVMGSTFACNANLFFDNTIPAGPFTAELTPAPSAPIQAPGFLAFNVVKFGGFKLIGGLPDGTKVSASGYLTFVGEDRATNKPIHDLAFSTPLYKKKGHLTGRMHVTFPGDPSATPAIGDGTGSIRWAHPVVKTGPVLTAFGTILTPRISRYNVPKGAPVLPVVAPSALALDFTGGGNPAATVAGTLGLKNIVAFPLATAGKPSVKFDAKTGIFTGKYTPAGALKPLPFSGVLIRNRGDGIGYFINGTNVGTVKISTP
jgi:hypothetical protein